MNEALYGLEQHLLDPAAPRDQQAVDAWVASSEGKAFMRGSGEAWGEAERTIAAYTGA